MAGNTFGKIFRITTWGESHGKALGVTVDGCPAGIEISEEYIQTFLDRRKPGQSKYTTARAEGDEVEIVSGVFEGKTTGCPITMIVRNKDQHSADYTNIMNSYRPGHADYTFDEKYGFRDYRGGGRTSGRETIGRVAAGAIASKLLEQYGIKVVAYTKAIGPVEIDDEKFSLDEMNNNKLYMPDADAAVKAQEYLDECLANQDSSGGVIECVITGCPVGLGEPVFDKCDALLAQAVMSIGAVKGFEIGDGFEAAKARGSINNDSFRVDADGNIVKATNHSGGTLGGLTDGSDIIFRAAVKPTPSISQVQKTVNRDHENIKMEIKGRHDPIIVPRAVVVVESMAAVTIADLYLRNLASKI